MTLDKLKENEEGKTNLLEAFDKFKATQTAEQMKKFYDDLEELNSYRNFLQLQCDRMNKQVTGGKFVVVEREGHLSMEWREKV